MSDGVRESVLRNCSSGIPSRTTDMSESCKAGSPNIVNDVDQRDIYSKAR